MATESLASALEREHQEIDHAIASFAAGLARGDSRPEPLLRANHALRRHIYLEERFLFPAVKQAGLVAPVFVMLREHGEIWKRMEELERQLSSCVDASTMLMSCRQLDVQLRHHNLKEERILYPEVEPSLAGSARAELTAFRAAGQMPEGWACERAR